MAEGGVIDQVSDETQKELQECPICYTKYKDRRMLNCSHSFCLKCLQELKLTRKDEKNIVCPLCRKETVLTEAGVDVLPVSKVADQQEQTEGQVLKVTCQACDEETEAISRCVNCKHYLCRDCQKAHTRMAVLKGHKIVALHELPLESEETTGDTELKKAPKCRKHPDQDLCLYCNTCEVLICDECTSFDHKQSLHSHASIYKALSRCKQEVNEAVSKTKECIEEFILVNPSAADSRRRLDDMLAKTYSEISQKAVKEIAKITAKKQQLGKIARDIATKRDTEFAYAETSELILIKVNDVMTTATWYEILESKKKILRDLNEQVEVHESLDIRHDKSFLGFKESEQAGQLGNLLLGENQAFATSSSASALSSVAFANLTTLACSTQSLTSASPYQAVATNKPVTPYTRSAFSEQAVAKSGFSFRK